MSAIITVQQKLYLSTLFNAVGVHMGHRGYIRLPSYKVLQIANISTVLLGVSIFTSNSIYRSVYLIV